MFDHYYFFKDACVRLEFSWQSVGSSADWNQIVYRAIGMFLLPPISCVGGVILNQAVVPAIQERSQDD